jgi:hypothetical protein
MFWKIYFIDFKLEMIWEEEGMDWLTAVRRERGKMLGSWFSIKDAFCVMLILEVWKRKETGRNNWRESRWWIYKSYEEWRSVRENGNTIFFNNCERHFIFISLSAFFFFFVLWIDMEGAVKIQEKEYSKYCHRLKINANSAVCSETSGSDMKSNFLRWVGQNLKVWRI